MLGHPMCSFAQIDTWGIGLNFETGGWSLYSGKLVTILIERGFHSIRVQILACLSTLIT
jgi:hypothetical protein